MVFGEGGGCAAENDRDGESNPGLEHGLLHLSVDLFSSLEETR
jgi:hypothetical protein